MKSNQPTFSHMNATPDFIKNLVGTTRKYSPSVYREKPRHMTYHFMVYWISVVICGQRVCNRTFRRDREKMNVEFLTIIERIYIVFCVIFTPGK